MPEQEFNAIFSKRVRYYLNKYEITQAELAKKLGVGTTSVYNWCNGIKTPRMDKVDAMCELFNCKRSDLMEDKSETLSDESAIISIKVAKSPELKRLITYYEALSESGRKTIMNNIISLQSDGDNNSERVLAYYNALNPKGKQRVMENAEEMLQLYPKEEEENE